MLGANLAKIRLVFRMLELNVCKTLFIRKEQILVERVGYEIVEDPSP